MVLFISPQPPMEETTRAIPTGSPFCATPVVVEVMAEAEAILATVVDVDVPPPLVAFPPTLTFKAGITTVVVEAGGLGDACTAAGVDPPPAAASSCCPFSGLMFVASILGEVAGVSMPKLSYLMLTGDEMGVEDAKHPLEVRLWPVGNGEIISVAAAVVVVVRFVALVKPDCAAGVSVAKVGVAGVGGGGGVIVRCDTF